jgi:iron complex outermembrane recepter protein
MWVRSVVFLFWILPGIGLKAQQCLQVVDAGSRNPVPFCQIFDGAGAPLTITGLDGMFCLSGTLPAAVVLQAAGFHARRVELDDLVDDRIALEPLRVELPEVRITPDPQRSLGTAMLTATRLDSTLLWNFERAGLNSAMQWVPGVQMDQRGHGGSTRLSIRGSLLRSPFGVRGVKVYWGGLPVTLADGSTPLELLDPELVGTMQVVRSVGPPAYGSAPSGLLLVQPPWPVREGIGLDASITGGSFGFQRMAATGSWSKGRHSVVVGGVHQRNEGYRDQESSARDQLFLISRHQLRRFRVQGLLTIQQVAWQLPGGLSAEMAAAAPRSANAYSQLIDARLEKRQLLAGILAEYRPVRNVSILLAVHGQVIDKLNPFGTSPAFSGYKEEDIQATGTRIALAWERRIARWSAGLNTGSEILAQRDRLDERVYVDAIPDSFRTRADTRVRNMNLFAEIRLTGPHGTEIFAAAGMEYNAHDHRDLLSGPSVSMDRFSDPMPVLGVSQRLAPRWWVSLRHGGAVSRPTVWELLGSDGRFDTRLSAEVIRETELALTHGAPGDRIQIQLAGYIRNTDGTILPVPSAQGTGNDFANAGTASQNGVEGSFHLRLGGRPERETMFIGTFTLQEHTIETNDRPQGHRIPGIPAIMAGGFVRQQGPWRTFIELGVRHVDEIPVGAVADRSLPGYQVAHLRGGWSPGTLRGVAITTFLHIENLTDTNYTTFVQASDPLGRYHNPAPGRSFFAGIRFQHRQAPR